MTSQTTRIDSSNPADTSNLTVRVMALTVSLLVLLTSYTLQTVEFLLRPLTPLERFYGITKEPILEVSDAVASASLLIIVLISFLIGPTIIRRSHRLQPLRYVDSYAYNTFQECCELSKLNYVPKCYVTDKWSDDCFAFGI